MARGSGAAAFLAGMGSSYFKTSASLDEKAKAEARQAKEDGYKDEQRARDRETYNREQQQRRDYSDAAAPVAVVPVQALPPEMDARDIGTPGAGALVDTGQFRAGQVVLPDRAAADAAAKSANTYDARNQRMIDAAMTHGDFKTVRDLRQDKLAMAQATELEKSITRDDLFRAQAAAFQSGGHEGLAKYMTDKYDDGMTYKIAPGEKGGYVASRFDKDGKALGTMKFADDIEMLQYGALRSDPSKYLDFAEKRRTRTEDRADKDRTFGLEERKVDAQIANDKSRTAATWAGVSARVNGAGGKPDSMPDHAKTQYSALMSQATRIETSINDAIAKGEISPEGLKQLRDNQALIEDRASQLVEQYGDKGKSGSKGTDPVAALFARDKPKPGPAAAAPVNAVPAAAAPAARQASIAGGANPLAAARAEAQQRVMAYGSRQKLADPQGYAAAVAALQQTEAALFESQRNLPAIQPGQRIPLVP